MVNIVDQVKKKIKSAHQVIKDYDNRITKNIIGDKVDLPNKDSYQFKR